MHVLSCVIQYFTMSTSRLGVQVFVPLHMKDILLCVKFKCALFKSAAKFQTSVENFLLFCAGVFSVLYKLHCLYFIQMLQPLLFRWWISKKGHSSGSGQVGISVLLFLFSIHLNSPSLLDEYCCWMNIAQFSNQYRKNPPFEMNTAGFISDSTAKTSSAIHNYSGDLVQENITFHHSPFHMV